MQNRKTEHRARLKNSIEVTQILSLASRHCSHLKDILNCVKPANQTSSACSRTGAKCQTVPEPRTATKVCFSQLVQALRLHSQRATTCYERDQTTRYAIYEVLIGVAFTLAETLPLSGPR
jgi:hypothetical protein